MPVDLTLRRIDAVHVSPQESYVTLRYLNDTVNVSIENLSRVTQPKGSLVQVIGDLELGYDGKYRLIARILRSVDGMDVELYYKTAALIKEIKT